MITAVEIATPWVKRLAGLPGLLVPYAIQKPILASVLNEAFRKPLEFGELDFLEDRLIRIRIQDLRIDWLLTIRKERFLPLAREQQEDVCISGESPDFVLLATRRADPDTLFFQRRICIVGDTELGLGVKNTMDGMDWDDLPPVLRRLLLALGDFFDRFGDLMPARFRV